MILFNVNQTLTFNIGVDLFSLSVLAILYIGCRISLSKTYDVILLQRMNLFVQTVLVTDVFTWLINGKPGTLFRILGYAGNTCYFVMEFLLVYGWIQYTYLRVYLKKLDLRKSFFWYVLPFSFFLLLAISTPFTNALFYLDENNWYQRGVISSPSAVFALCYLVAASLMTLAERKKASLIERREELLAISLFPVFPFIGGVLQTFTYGCSLIWPCITLAFLIIYINKDRQTIAQDALTGLNNRGTLNRYLQSLEESSGSHLFSAIMMDIDQFKMINDRYGHDAGDVALIQFSNILKMVFRQKPAFLARYGGDEFIAILSGVDQSELEKIRDNILNALREFNQTKSLSYDISISAGCAIENPEKPISTLDLIKEADEAMYLNKKQKHDISDDPISN